MKERDSWGGRETQAADAYSPTYICDLRWACDGEVIYSGFNAQLTKCEANYSGELMAVVT